MNDYPDPVNRIPVLVSCGDVNYCAICRRPLTAAPDIPHTYAYGLQFHTVCFETAIRQATNTGQVRDAITEALREAERKWGIGGTPQD